MPTPPMQAAPEPRGRHEWPDRPMKLVHTDFEGLMLLQTTPFDDRRGRFLKVFHEEWLAINGSDLHLREVYYSISGRDVIRGMHFQSPPHHHLKIVYVPHGRVLDVVLDIRGQSPTYGRFHTCELSAENALALIIPPGFAHGFHSLEDGTNVTYLQTSAYCSSHDHGVRYDSFGFIWNVQNPILSDRDLGFPRFSEFQSPFLGGETA